MKHPRYSILAAAALVIGSACRDCAAQDNLMRWPIGVSPILVYALWSYDLQCSHLQPLPSHDVWHVTWEAANLIEFYQRADSVENPGRQTVGYHTVGDTILIDTSMIFSEPRWVAHKVMAHELLHVLLADRPLPDTLMATRDHYHPAYPFASCDLLDVQRDPLPFDSAAADPKP